MTPRRDPETAPILYAVQLVRRATTNRYGGEMRPAYAAKTFKYRPVETRNGLPWRPYRYRGTGESLSVGEAESRLCG